MLSAQVNEAILCLKLENYIVNFENPICEPFDAKYELYSYSNYLVEKIQIKQDPEVKG